MKLNVEDHYAVLGVPRTASNSDIRSAFRKKAKEYHPDTSDRCDADKLFKLLNRSYSVLKDRKKRDAYNVELMGDIFQQQVVDPARKRVFGFGYSADVAEDEWGWRVG